MLYFFWTVVLLPMTALWNINTYLTSGNHYSPWVIIAHGIQQLLFAAFPASWYIIASIIAILILYRIPKKYNQIMLLASFGLYLVCCISSNYYNLFDTGSVMIRFIEIFGVFIKTPHTSFLVAFIWMGIGKVFAESKVTIAPIAGTFGIILSAILLYAEYFVIKTFSLSKADDCYMLLVPLCFFLFNVLKNADSLKIKNAVSMRKASTIIYCSHMTVSRIYGVALKYVFHCQIGILIFAMTVITCLIGCYFVFKLEGKKYFKWLKYSY